LGKEKKIEMKGMADCDIIIFSAIVAQSRKRGGGMNSLALY